MTHLRSSTSYCEFQISINPRNPHKFCFTISFTNIFITCTYMSKKVIGFIPDGFVARSGLSSEGSKCNWHITHINLEDVIFSPWHKVSSFFILN